MNVFRVLLAVAIMAGAVVLGVQAMGTGNGMAAIFSVAALLFGVAVLFGKKAE